MALEIRLSVEVGTPDGGTNVRIATIETVIEPDAGEVGSAFALASEALDGLMDNARLKVLGQLGDILAITGTGDDDK